MMRKHYVSVLLHLVLIVAVALSLGFSVADISKKPYSEIVGDRPVATMHTSEDDPAQDNSTGEFDGDSWYEAGITVTTGIENDLFGWDPNGDPLLYASPGGSDLLLILDEAATELGLNWYWSGSFYVTLYSDASHAESIGGVSFSPSEDGETGRKENGYDLGVLSTAAFQSVRISTATTYATIDDLVFVPSPEPSLLIAQLGALLTFSVLCWKRR